MWIRILSFTLQYNSPAPAVQGGVLPVSEEDKRGLTKAVGGRDGEIRNETHS